MSVEHFQNFFRTSRGGDRNPFDYHPGHSADVSMRLLINGASLRIAQMGPDFLLVDADTAHEAGDATILMRVDASERRWDVHLPQGIAACGMQEVIVAMPAGQPLRQDRSLAAAVRR